MRIHIVNIAILAAVGLSGCMGAARTDLPELRPPGPVQTVTTEQGVVPPGTALVIRTNDNVITSKAYRDTVYDASVAEDVVDQHGTVLIPKGSPVELGVVSISFLGPGGEGMTKLVLGVRALTVNGMRYPVETAGNGWDRDGGLEEDRFTAKWVGGGGEDRVLTSGRRIDVPTGTLLAFRTDDPIRLKSYQR